MKDWVMIKNRRLVAGIFILLSYGSVGAQRVDTTTVQHIDEVTVKAVRMPKQVMAPVPVQAFSADHIEQLGLQNMADAVRRFSGTTVRDYGGIGGLKTVSVRSLGAYHTGVAYDQVAVSNCQAGQIDIGRFSLDNVGMVSLAVGQNDNLLQSARLYASGAVLSILSVRPDPSEAKKFGFKGQVRVGSFGQVNPYVRFTQKVGQRTLLAVDGDWMRADGMYPFTLKNGALVTKEKRENSDITAWHTEANLYHTFKAQAKLNVKAYYYNSERGLPNSVVYYTSGRNERLWDENFLLQAHYEKVFNSRWKMQAQAKYDYSWNKYADFNVQYENGKQIDVNRQNEYYGSSTLLYQPLKELSVSLAQDVAYNTLDKNSNMPNEINPRRWTSLTALNAQLAFERVTVVGGLLNTFISNKIPDGQKVTQKCLTPSVSVSYRPFHTEYLNIRGLYKQSYRVPAFNDLYYERLGNTGLRPEKATEYNLGLGWSRSLGRWADYLSINVDFFHNDVKDKIVAFPQIPVSKMVNYGRVSVDGVDLNASLKSRLSDHWAMVVSGGYTFQKAINVTSKEDKNYKDQIPYTPKHSGNGSVTAETLYGILTYSFMAVGERYVLAQNLPENRVDGYFEQNLSYSNKFKIGAVRLGAQFDLVNLFNIQYDVIKFYPMPGRQFRLTFKVEL